MEILSNIIFKVLPGERLQPTRFTYRGQKVPLAEFCIISHLVHTTVLQLHMLSAYPELVCSKGHRKMLECLFPCGNILHF